MEKTVPVLKKAGKVLLGILKNPAGRIAAIVLAALLAFAVIWGGSETVTEQQTQVTSFGFENIGELATHAGYYTNVNVHEEDRKLFNWTIPLTQSKYIFSYSGIIKAGYDFSQVKVETDPAALQVNVTLPEVKILSNEIDPSSLKVYDERQSIFTPLSIEDVNAAQESLREEAEKTAIANGMFDSARENMQLLIRGFLSGTFDFSEYELVFR